tara:strand:- start:1358 stop:1858 length:501 start_codon:yes stop_codon:yes gene_type:complete
MKLNPFKYIIKRYYSKDLTPYEFKLMNFWLPFLFNRIHIINVSDNFKKVTVLLKHTFWNRNPNKSLWGGALFSAVDPFYPMMIKQILLREDIKTQFLTKSAHIEYLKESKTNITFTFSVSDKEIDDIKSILNNTHKYDGWHTVYGIDKNNNQCIKAKIQVYLKLLS